MRLDHGRLGRRGAALATACSLLGTCARRASRRASLTSSTRFLAITGAPRHRDRSARPSPSRPCRRARSRPALDGNRAPPSRPPPGARRHSRRPCSTRPVWGPWLAPARFEAFGHLLLCLYFRRWRLAGGLAARRQSGQDQYADCLNTAMSSWRRPVGPGAGGGTGGRAVEPCGGPAPGWGTQLRIFGGRSRTSSFFRRSITSFMRRFSSSRFDAPVVTQP
jgi:hypothetical protein